MPTCPNCGNEFEIPRRRHGGTPKKFCSAYCRWRFHRPEPPEQTVTKPPVEHEPDYQFIAAPDDDWPLGCWFRKLDLEYTLLQCFFPTGAIVRRKDGRRWQVGYERGSQILTPLDGGLCIRPKYEKQGV